MRAHRWRRKLIGPKCTLKRVRGIPLHLQTTSQFDTQIRLDLARSNLTDHVETLAGILNLFSFVNRGMGYSQGMNLLLKTLWEVFYDDDPKHAVQDSYFALSTLVGLLRPMYPLHKYDTSPVEYVTYISRLVKLKLGGSIHFSDTLHLLVQAWIQSKGPVLFVNMFSGEDLYRIWDHIFACKFVCEGMVWIFASILKENEQVISHMDHARVMRYVRDRHYYVSKVILHAAQLKAGQI